MTVETQPAGVRGVNVVDGIRMALFSSPGRGRLALPGAGGGTVLVGGCFSGMCTVSRREVLDVVGPGDAFLLADAAGQGELAPLGQFSGFVILLVPDGLPAPTQATLEGFDVCVSALSDLLAGTSGFAWLTGIPAVGHVMGELVAGAQGLAGEGFFRLKAIELLRAICSGKRPAAASGQATRDATRMTHEALAYSARSLLMEDLGTPKTIGQVADACGTSPTVLKQAFHETFGLPVYQWYRAYRIRQAADTLAVGGRRTISEVAMEVGYANPSKFTSAFRAVMGTSPSAWRAASRVGNRAGR